jgi:hypothetical protein
MTELKLQFSNNGEDMCAQRWGRYLIHALDCLLWGWREGLRTEEVLSVVALLLISGEDIGCKR